MAVDYCSIADVKAAMGITLTTDDTRLQRAVTTASRQIETACDRQFWQTDTATSRVFVAENRWVVQTDDFDNAQTITVKTDPAGDRTWPVTWTTADYQTEPLNNVYQGQYWPNDTVRAIRGLYFPEWSGTMLAQRNAQAQVQVTAKWGWAEIPDQVSEATVIQAEFLFKSAEVPLGATPFGEMGVLRLRQSMNPVALSLLEAYQKDTVHVW